MGTPERITVDSKVLCGKAVVRGTRISVEFVVGLLAAGWSHAQILSSYPHLTEEDILACERREQLEALKEATGAWADADHPRLANGAEAWVREMREASIERLREIERGRDAE